MRTKLNKKDLSYLKPMFCYDGGKIIKAIQKSQKPLNRLIQKYSTYIIDYIDFIISDRWKYVNDNYYISFDAIISTNKAAVLSKILNRYYGSNESIKFSEKEIDEIINVTAFMIDRLKAIDTFFKKIDFEYK